MKYSRLLLTLTAALGLMLSPANAQETPPASPPASAPAAELAALVQKIVAKLQTGARSEAALVSELGEFDALLEKHKAEKTEDVARILVSKAMLYAQVLDNNEKALTLLRQVKVDFPDTDSGKTADRMIAAVEAQVNAAAAHVALIGKPAPALTFTWSNREGLKSLADLKGKVVVLDFWATWCGPCIRSFPEVAEVVSHYEGFDVEVVGVTSLQGRVSNLEPKAIDCKDDPAKETGLMPAFVEKHKMTWAVVFSEQPVFNQDYAIHGIPYMAILAPDGTIRHTGLHPAMPHAEKVAMIDAILKEFGLKVPAKS